MFLYDIWFYIAVSQDVLLKLPLAAELRPIVLLLQQWLCLINGGGDAVHLMQYQ